MGNLCASSQFTNEGGRIINPPPSTVKIIHLNGRLQELKQQVQANNILSKNPNCFLCTAESMELDACPPHVPEHEELQPGQIYFLLPLSPYSKSPLSLQDLCSLAIKAGDALAGNPSNARRVVYSMMSPVSDRPNGVCNVTTGIDMAGMSSKAGRGNQRNEF